MEKAINYIIVIVFMVPIIIIVFTAIKKFLTFSNAIYKTVYQEPKTIEEPQEEEEEPIADFSQDLWDMAVRRMINIRNAAMMAQSCDKIEKACNELLRRYVDGERTMKLYDEMNKVQFVGKWEAYLL